MLVHLDRHKTKQKRRKIKLPFFISTASSSLSRVQPSCLDSSLRSKRAAVLLTEFSKKMLRFLNKKLSFLKKVDFFFKKVEFF